MNEKWRSIYQSLEAKVKSESFYFADTQPSVSFFENISSGKEYIQLNFASDFNGIYLARSLYADASASILQDATTF